MEYGAHLPLISFGGASAGLSELRAYAQAAAALGYRSLCANDHLLFQRPWLDGPTALAAVIPDSGDLRLATTVSLPVVRGPVPLAKSLAAIDYLSGGRLDAGLGPGSSARDYEAVGLDFDERWARLDDAVRALRALWAPQAAAHAGPYYDTTGITLEPGPCQQPPPIWIGSWGSRAGLRRVARLADGWLASGYNTTPADFGRAKAGLDAALAAAGREPSTFPNAIATMWCYVSDDAASADRLLNNVLAPTLRRDPDALRAQLPIGSAAHCAQIFRAYAKAGAQRIHLWPLANEVDQLRRFHDTVFPLVETEPPSS